MRNLSSLIVLVVCFSLDVKAQFNWQTLDAPNSSATFIDGIDGIDEKIAAHIINKEAEKHLKYMKI
jgi:hypothetical protein